MRIIPIAALAALLSSCSSLFTTSTNRMIQEAELVNAPINDTISCRNEMGLYVVYVQINNQEEPLEFIFDTGANLTVVSKEAADRLGLEPDGEISLGDSKNQRQNINLTMIDTLQLGEGLYTNIIAAIVEYPEKSTIRCIAKDGILGYHVIRQLQWSIHPGDTLMIGSTADMRGDGVFNTMRMRGWKSPRLDVTFGEVTYHNTLFDSGSTGSFDVEKRHIEHYGDSLPMIEEIDGTSQGIYGTLIDTVQRVLNDTVSLSGLSIPANIEFSGAEGRKIGMRTLGRFHLIIDGPNEALHIGSEEISYSPTRTYGLIPGLSDSTLFISSFEPQGNAAQAGLKFQQPLESVNGITAEDINAMECGYIRFLKQIRSEHGPLEIKTKDGRLYRISADQP